MTVIHLSILNSRILLLVITLITSVFIILFELIYSSNDTKVTYSRNYVIKKYELLRESKLGYGVIIGDSRGKCGINSELLKSNSNLHYINLCDEGANAFVMIKDFLKIKNKPEIIIMAVSPADIFGFIDSCYYDDNTKINDYFEPILAFPFKLRNPYSVIENKITENLQSKIRFNLGFNEITNIMLYGKISKYSTADGWTSNNRFGSYKKYSEVLNQYYYEYLLLEYYKNNKLISLIKSGFQNTIEQFFMNKTKIIFVRIPTSKIIKEIEDQKYPWFDDYFLDLENKYQTKYLIFNGFLFNEKASDGSHLSNDDAIKFSEILSNSISGL